MPFFCTFAGNYSDTVISEMTTDTLFRLPDDVRACLFDFDFTLADGSPWIVECYQKILQQHGFTGIKDETIRGTIGLTVEDSFARMTGLTDYDRCRQLRIKFKAICRPQIAAKTAFFKDALNFVERLKAAGIRSAIVSTKETVAIHQTLAMHHVEQLFDCVVGLTEVTAPKPSPEGINYALKQLQLLPEETIYFGDNPVDGEAARRAGTKYIGVAKGMHTPQQLSEFPHLAIIENYDHLLLPLPRQSK